MRMSENANKFIAWNKALFNHFFPKDLEEDEEVSLFIDRETINEIGQSNNLGGYEEFINLIMLPIASRRQVFTDIWRLYVGTNMSDCQRQKSNSPNIFDFATIFIDEALYFRLECPLFMIYVAFVILMGSEAENGIGNYITARLRRYFPRHTDRRDSLDLLFNALADRYPQFHADILTAYRYVGLIRYQLGLSKGQEDALKKAMYFADISEDVPYDMWVSRIKDYVDEQMRGLLSRSERDSVLRRRVSDLRSNFDPSIYVQRHRNEEIFSRGNFVLAVYEDEYSVDEDRLVLLTDVNNKTIDNGDLKITIGTLDRLGEYAEYNVNHVLIGNNDRAEMRTYFLRDDENRISSVPLGNIVIFSRCSNNYLIQTQYPRRGIETYILVKNGHEEEWNNWQRDHGAPMVVHQNDQERVSKIFGNGWQMYISNEIEFAENVPAHAAEFSITMNGGIKRIGMNKVYLISALPYFEFSEPINIDNLSVYINLDGALLEENDYTLKIVDKNKLVVDFINIEPKDNSIATGITLEYKIQNRNDVIFHEDFKVIGQEVNFNDDDLFKIDMWGRITNGNDDQQTYMKGFELFNGTNNQQITERTGFYQNNNESLDINDPRFYLISLITAECSMRRGFSITEPRLKKCIRYAATRFDIDITSNPSFYTKIKYLLINSGYINADFEQNRYQPLPPTFIKTNIGLNPGRNLFMLVGSYTQKFLVDLKNYCEKRGVLLYLHSIENDINSYEDLIPPVILLYHSFDPHDFIEKTNSKCLFIDNDDAAINIIRSIPTYNNYEATLQQDNVEVIDNQQLDAPVENDFPRIRSYRTTGYGSPKWIEMNSGDFYRINVKDLAWANLYCLYKKQKPILTKDLRCLMFPVKMHLPVMMQRALYILNFGIPKKEKAFICNNDDNEKGYYNLIKKYDIKDSHDDICVPLVIRAITGRLDNEENISVRNHNESNYKLYLWKNLNKQSKYPRSLLVVTDACGETVYGFGIRKLSDQRKTFEIYLRHDNVNYINARLHESEVDFKLIDSDNLNQVFSNILGSAKYAFADTHTAFNSWRIKTLDRVMKLPPREEFEIEEITII